MNPNYPRIVAYVTASFTLGMMVYIFTNLFYPFLLRPDWIGTLVLVVYGLIYFSLSLSIARRYIRKTNSNFSFPYILIPFFVVPTAVFAHFHEKFSMPSESITFYLTITVGATLGAYYGIKAGLKQRDKLIEQIRERREAAEKTF
ncbi:MAG TPA: hypothetical protein DCE78_01425 [Bacteroidetes bacterium]|nr:hypothetical protein [Bacteroidota bacterium]